MNIQNMRELLWEQQKRLDIAQQAVDSLNSFMLNYFTRPVDADGNTVYDGTFTDELQVWAEEKDGKLAKELNATIMSAIEGWITGKGTKGRG